MSEYKIDILDDIIENNYVFHEFLNNIKYNVILKTEIYDENPTPDVKYMKLLNLLKNEKCELKLPFKKEKIINCNVISSIVDDIIEFYNDGKSSKEISLIRSSLWDDNGKWLRIYITSITNNTYNKDGLAMLLIEKGILFNVGFVCDLIENKIGQKILYNKAVFCINGISLHTNNVNVLCQIGNNKIYAMFNDLLRNALKAINIIIDEKVKYNYCYSNNPILHNIDYDFSPFTSLLDNNFSYTFLLIPMICDKLISAKILHLWQTNSSGTHMIKYRDDIKNNKNEIIPKASYITNFLKNKILIDNYEIDPLKPSVESIDFIKKSYPYVYEGCLIPINSFNPPCFIECNGDDKNNINLNCAKLFLSNTDVYNIIKNTHYLKHYSNFINHVNIYKKCPNDLNKYFNKELNEEERVDYLRHLTPSMICNILKLKYLS